MRVFFGTCVALAGVAAWLALRIMEGDLHAVVAFAVLVYGWTFATAAWLAYDFLRATHNRNGDRQ